ncbi:MAG: cell division protein FtsZ [bacterium]
MLVKPDSEIVAKIKVIGIGGGGTNAVNTMISQYDIQGVEFIGVNTDAQALKNSLASTQLQIGTELTRGLGVGGDPELGAKAAEESVDAVHEHLAGADMVFITCGMGGGTGTGAAPVIASIAKNLGALTVAVVTKPFHFEGSKRMTIALEGIEDLKDKVDTLIVVPNQRLLEIVDKNISFLEAMRKVDEVLAMAVKSIAGLVTQTGFINVDFADVKSIMLEAGSAWMGIGRSSGENRAEEAAKQAISSPLLETSINGSTAVLLTITGGPDLSMHEVQQAAELVRENADGGAQIIFGAAIDEDMKEDIEITVLATGFRADPQVMPTTKIASTTPSSFPDFDEIGEMEKGKKDKKDKKKEDLDFSEKNGFPDDEILKEEDDDELEVPAFMRRKK